MSEFTARLRRHAHSACVLWCHASYVSLRVEVLHSDEARLESADITQRLVQIEGDDRRYRGDYDTEGPALTPVAAYKERIVATNLFEGHRVMADSGSVGRA